MFAWIGKQIDEFLEGCLLVLGWCIVGVVIDPVISIEWYVWLSLSALGLLICLRVLVFVFDVLAYLIAGLTYVFGVLWACFGALRACFEARPAASR